MVHNFVKINGRFWICRKMRETEIFKERLFTLYREEQIIVEFENKANRGELGTQQNKVVDLFGIG